MVRFGVFSVPRDGVCWVMVFCTGELCKRCMVARVGSSAQLGELDVSLFLVWLVEWGCPREFCWCWFFGLVLSRGVCYGILSKS